MNCIAWFALPHWFPLFAFHTLDKEKLLDGCCQMALHKPGTSIHLMNFLFWWTGSLEPFLSLLLLVCLLRFGILDLVALIWGGGGYFFIEPAFQPQWPYLLKPTPSYQPVSSLHSRNCSFTHVPDVPLSQRLAAFLQIVKVKKLSFLKAVALVRLVASGSLKECRVLLYGACKPSTAAQVGGNCSFLPLQIVGSSPQMVTNQLAVWLSILAAVNVSQYWINVQ